MSHSIPEEISRFSALAEDWWNPQGRNRALHLIQTARLDFIRTHCPIANMRWLDVGCGGGLLSEALAREGAQVQGIDLSEPMIRIAREHARESALDIDYQTIALADWSANQSKASALTCLELLEHVPDPQAIVRECAEAVTAGGWCFFSTINRKPQALISTIVLAEYVLGWVERGTHHYGQFIRPSELIGWCAQAKLQVRALSGLTYSLTTGQFKLSADCSANYILATQKTV